MRATGSAFRVMIRRFQLCRSGATAIEYGLIAALVSVAMIAAFSQLGDDLSDMWTAIEVAVTNAS